MRRTSIIAFALLLTLTGAWANDKTITSPDGKLTVNVKDSAGLLTYTANYDGQQILKPSRLGFKSSFGDLTNGLSIKDSRDYKVDKSYDMTRTKKAHVDFHANAADINIENTSGNRMTVTFVVANNDVAYRYSIPRQKNDDPKAATIFSEASSFNFPDSVTTTFLCPQITPMSGWERSKPSYEEEYTADAPMDTTSQYGVGYTFPCLFHIKAQSADNGSDSDDYWALVSETGVDGNYVGSRLSDYSLPSTRREQRQRHTIRSRRASILHSVADNNHRQQPTANSRDNNTLRPRRPEVRSLNRLQARTLHMELAVMAGSVRQLQRPTPVHRPCQPFRL